MATPEGELAAQQFISAIRSLNRPPQGSLERDIQKRTGVSIFSFSPQNRKPLPEELQEHIFTGVSSSLKHANITDSFKRHILGMVEEQVNSGMMRVLEPDFILRQCGFYEGDNLGFFDPTKAREIETNTFVNEYPNRSSIREFAEAHNAKMENWRRDFIRTYRTDPLSQH